MRKPYTLYEVCFSGNGSPFSSPGGYMHSSLKAAIRDLKRIKKQGDNNVLLARVTYTRMRLAPRVQKGR